MEVKMFSKSTNKLSVVISFLLIMFILPLNIAAQEIIEIQVSPHVLNLQNQGEVVTIHTDISYGSVLGSSVSLNGVTINSWKADDQGNFVAKFLMSAIKNLPLNIGGYNTMTLTGNLVSGGTFTGSEEILVVNVIPAGKK
jgi:hypothetical protein